MTEQNEKVNSTDSLRDNALQAWAGSIATLGYVLLLLDFYAAHGVQIRSALGF